MATTPPTGPVTAEPLSAEDEASLRSAIAHGYSWPTASATSIMPVLLATIDRERAGREAIQQEVSALQVALDDLLDDTEHIDHDCGDTDCPVSRARAVLAPLAPDTPAGAAPERPTKTGRPRCPECGSPKGRRGQRHLAGCRAGAAPESREETPE